MAAPPSSRLQKMLQAAVQSVQWTYSLFWQICPQQGILIWSDGYYNGAIKTRKTVQPMEVSTEEASLQRSQQLRELYDSLSSGDTNQPARRPSAALSPEDLTESEWFYLMCVSFSFPPGVGLPGKAYARRQHVWLTGANEVDSKTFSRAILAKSACIQTVLCIPILDGVLELGYTEKVQEDLGLVQHVKTFFNDGQAPNPPPPKPALSEHSTSNPAASLDYTRFHSPSVPLVYAAADPPVTADQGENNNVDEEEEEEEDDDDEEGDEEPESYSAETGRNTQQVPTENTLAVVAAEEPSELMQLDMSEDIKLGSPDDASNNLDSDFNMLAVSQSGNPTVNQRRAALFRDESNRRWQMLQEPSCSSLQPLSTGPQPMGEMSQEDTHYSQTVSTILQAQPARWTEPPSTVNAATYSTQSAFAKWTTHSDHHLHSAVVEGTSQWLLKYILFTVPFLHNKYRDENSPKSRDAVAAAARFRKGTPNEDLSANHVLAERRRREKLNERFIILRSLVPFVTKMDKASILGDTIEYVKQLRKKIQDLETRNKQMEADNDRPRSADSMQRNSSSKDQRSGLTTRSSGPDKKKMRIAEATKQKTVEPPPQTEETSVEVSIIESDALLELQCGYREGLLLDIMQMLREKLRIEITAVQSSLNNGFFTAELRAKVKDNMNGKKVSIMEVKRAINQIIP
ncbi:hypothetical protein ES332_A08G217300v1 [Gossypium tomentosum]|uniref:BHLH domain-containing protein n=1 Tax=Gossypium tomentosum TaxID=34277 RepID=A0A5D2PIW7_GOSTO|nr:hypothetical protein ES332_A08G217300v1 [Gossypium tomentosum]TYI15876.1 hypothetical protein ES332_A08G217300v1 [Gossypium tomentosum]